MEQVYTTYEKDIQINNYHDQIVIWFFGDVHRDTKACDVDRWKRFLMESSREDAYYFCMGDTHDFASTSEKKKIESSYLHETTIEKFDEMVQADNRAFCNEIKHMKGKLLGFIDGNHNWKMADGKTSTEDLASRMDAPYLGWLCHYSINIHQKNRGTSNTVHIVACHGKSGGKTYGITVNQVADLKTIFPVADIYVYGHDHQRWALPISVLVPTNINKWMIKQKQQMLCRSGSFKKSYEPNEAGYEARKLLKPSNLGALKMIISFHRERKDGRDVTYTELNAMV